LWCFGRKKKRPGKFGRRRGRKEGNKDAPGGEKKKKRSCGGVDTHLPRRGKEKKKKCYVNLRTVSREKKGGGETSQLSYRGGKERARKEGKWGGLFRPRSPPRKGKSPPHARSRGKKEELVCFSPRERGKGGETSEMNFPDSALGFMGNIAFHRQRLHEALGRGGGGGYADPASCWREEKKAFGVVSKEKKRS